MVDMLAAQRQFRINPRLTDVVIPTRVNAACHTQAQAIDKSISPEYRQIMADNWRSWFQRVTTSKRPHGVTQIVGFFDSKAYAAIAAETEPQNVAIAVLDRKTLHLGGEHKAGQAVAKAWPSDWVADLPNKLADYQAILHDLDNDTLLLITRDMIDDRVGKAVIRTDQVYGAQTVNSVVSLGFDTLRNLRQPRRYKVLSGVLVLKKE